jgi:hypothetical protein
MKLRWRVQEIRVLSHNVAREGMDLANVVEDYASKTRNGDFNAREHSK